MSMHWNAKKELQLAKLMLERENVSNQVSLKGQIKLEQCPRFEHQYELSMTCHLGRNMQIELFDSLPKSGSSSEDLREVIEAFAEDVSELERRQDEIVDDVKDFRKRLSKALAAERRKGIFIKGSIELGRVRAGNLTDWLPVIRLKFVGEDLRFRTLEYDVECYDDIDTPVRGVAEETAAWNAKRSDLKRIDAVGEVHPLLLDALAKRDQPVHEALASIYADRDGVQDIHDADGRDLIVSWRDGTLTGSFDVSEGIRFDRDELRVSDALHVSLTSKAGYTLGELLDVGEGYGGDLIISGMGKSHSGYQWVRFLHAAIPFGEDGQLIL